MLNFAILAHCVYITYTGHIPPNHTMHSYIYKVHILPGTTKSKATIKNANPQIATWWQLMISSIFPQLNILQQTVIKAMHWVFNWHYSPNPNNTITHTVITTSYILLKPYIKETKFAVQQLLLCNNCQLLPWETLKVLINPIQNLGVYKQWTGLLE